MEYCGGGSVADLMHASDVPLDQDMISYICAETLAGLAYLHSIGKACVPSTSLLHHIIHYLLSAACCLHETAVFLLCCASKRGIETCRLACFCCL